MGDAVQVVKRRLRTPWPIGFLCLLVLLAIPVQIHLAELDLDQDSGVLLENNGDLDGQYVLGLLTLLDNVERPIVPTPERILQEVPAVIVVVAPLIAPPRTDSRAPPRPAA